TRGGAPAWPATPPAQPAQGAALLRPAGPPRRGHFRRAARLSQIDTRLSPVTLHEDARRSTAPTTPAPALSLRADGRRPLTASPSGGGRVAPASLPRHRARRVRSAQVMPTHLRPAAHSSSFCPTSARQY